MSGAAPALRPASTFFGAPVADLEDLKPGDVAAVGVYCDHYSAGRPGGRFAPRQLRYSSTGTNAVGARRVVDIGDFNVFPLEPERTRAILCDQSERIVATGAKLFAIGGDYSVSPAIVEGIVAGCKANSLGLIRLSRRLDLMPVAMKPSNGPWRRSATNEISGLLTGGAEAVALIGARGDLAAEERHALSEMRVIPAAEVARNPSAAADSASKALRAIAGQFYLSVDVDVLEPRFGSVALPRTQGGLSLDELLAILTAFEDLPVVGAELTGHVPNLDVPGRLETTLMAGVAAKLLDCIASEP